MGKRRRHCRYAVRTAGTGESARSTSAGAIVGMPYGRVNPPSLKGSAVSLRDSAVPSAPARSHHQAGRVRARPGRLASLGRSLAL